MKKRISAILATGLLLANCACASSPYRRSEGHEGHQGQCSVFGTDRTMERYIVPERMEPELSREKLVELLQKRIKYVFVLYQENRSFDSYFGTFPGADGLFSQPASDTHGFYQTFTDTTGKQLTISPFRIGPGEYAADTDDIDHSHELMVQKMDVANGVPRMDKFAQVEETKWLNKGKSPLAAKQMGELAMAYEDGDTVPFLWRYANRFVLFDHIFQLMVGPSTPGNLSIFAAQTGQTQAALHQSDEFAGDGQSGPGVPVLNDSDPYWGYGETASGMPANPGDYPGYGTPQINQTYATLALTLAGKKAGAITDHDTNGTVDLADVTHDVSFLTKSGQNPVPWGWYEEGYNREPTDPGPVDASGTHASYVTHHNGPQYFGYISNNTEMKKNLHGLEDFFDAVQAGTLPKKGGIFFVKGGYQNIFGLKPADPDPTVQKNFLGDDDHPGYSDAQISEAMVARAVNAIARSKYWDKCAIIITWDDSEGDYDHVAPPVRSDSYSPDKYQISDGPRIPMILISPYARVHYIDKEQGDNGSVAKLADALYGLTPMAKLPDEMKGRNLGLTEFGQQNWGPDDAITSDVSDLTSAFDPARLAGRVKPLPPSYAVIPDGIVDQLPQQSGYGLKNIHVTPTDYVQGIQNNIPSDFNPRPNTNPTPVTP